ncbi:DUF421 domain-containing protein [Bacillus sp. RO2]|nr:DUF421 domain-containing protein [Bacillus sp. RO2]
MDGGKQISKPHVYPIATEVINDGKLNVSNLEKLNLNAEWIDLQFRSFGINSISEVQKDGTFYIDKNERLIKTELMFYPQF